MIRALNALAICLVCGTALGQTTYTGIINDTNVSYDVRSSGVKADGVTDDSTNLNNAIAYAVNNKFGIVQLPCGQIVVGSAINLTNRSSLTFRGCGMHMGITEEGSIEHNPPSGDTNTNITQILCNTGGVCIDTTGSSYLKLQDFDAGSLPSYTNPSTVILLQGRDNAAGGGNGPFCFAQFNATQNVHIYTGHSTSLNWNMGYIGVYNIGAEETNYNNTIVTADTPFFFSPTNDISIISSAYQTLATGCPASMTEVKFNNVGIRYWGGNGSNWGAGIRANGGTADFQLDANTEFFALNSSAAAVQFGAGNTTNWYIRGQFENSLSPGSVLGINNGANVDHLDMDVATSAGQGSGGNYINFFGAGSTISNSRIHVTYLNGTQRPLFNNGTETIRGSDIDLGTTVCGTSFNSITLAGVIVHASGCTDSQVTFSPSSQYLLLDDTGISVQGGLNVNGVLTKSSGSFRIDHPLDPQHKYLYHSFVESPDMMNIYNGIVTLDSKGRAVVKLPRYFEALNEDFRYQLTAIGGYARLYVAQEIKGNCFRIAGGRPGLRVSWQVTGVRHDPYANAHRMVVEEEKPAINATTEQNAHEPQQK